MKEESYIDQLTEILHPPEETKAKVKYIPPANRSATNGGNLKQNIYSPKPESLKQGTLKGRVAVYLSDRRTIIYVKKGHNIRKAKVRYEELIAKYNQVERRGASGYQKKEEEEENLLKD